ncbi:hypothetical protein KKB55_02550, partial [Myxococcota bacterium]|nr:hypothetical protein [Myxococcota bacterium]
LNRAAGLRKQPEDRHFSDFIRSRRTGRSKEINLRSGFFLQRSACPSAMNRAGVMAEKMSELKNDLCLKLTKIDLFRQICIQI